MAILANTRLEISILKVGRLPAIQSLRESFIRLTDYQSRDTFKLETILDQHGIAFVGIELHLGKWWFNVSK